MATIGRATWIRSFHVEVSSGRVFAEAWSKNAAVRSLRDERRSS
jgi:hypothetical protein